VGLRWWANPALAVGTVGLVFWIGRRLHSPFAGMIAALLLATQEWFVFEATGAMPHIGTAAALTVATAALLASETRNGIPQVILRVLGGSSLGLAVAMRPLTGVAIGASVGLWMIVRGGWRPAQLLRLGLPVALGLAVPAILVLHYNATVTGDPLVFGYKAVHGPLHDLGFGLRGYHYFFGALEPVVRAQPFTMEIALRHLHARSWEFALDLLPLFMVLPVLWLALARGARVRGIVVGAFLLLPLAYFFYFASTRRFYAELVPFAAIGLALLIAQLAATDWRRTAAPLLGLLALLGAVRLTTIDRRGDVVWKRVVASAGQLEDAHARHGPLLVFVEEALPEAYLFRRLWQFNADGFDSRILVARSQGVRDAELARAFPNRTALRGTWRGGANQPMVLEPLR
jgi:4-amino-4-deoxy-L-arabinose transferase-like glycosyltransferase